MLAAMAGCPGGTGDDGGNGGTNNGSSNGENQETPLRAFQIGEIERFGSIFVNGLEIDTTGTTFTYDDRPGTEDNLRVGMRIKAEVEVHSDGTLHAHHVAFDDEVHGTIDAEDLAPFHQKLATGRLTVMGQNVRVDDQTAFHNCSPGDLLPGQVVQISGPRDALGTIHATLVDRRGLGFDDLPENERELEVKGVVSGLDTVAQTFQVGGLTVDFAGALLDTALLAVGGVANGIFVEARGAQAVVNGVLVAASVSLEDRALGLGDEARVKGLVTEVTSTTDFVLDGHPVRTNLQTLFKRGTPTDIVVGRVVEAEGVVSTTGVLVAREVSFELADNIKFEAVHAEAVDLQAETITVLGVDVKVDASTSLEDDSASGIRLFKLADLRPNDHLCVRAFVDAASGQVIATKVEREDPRTDGRVLFQGPIDPNASSPQTLVILGATIDTSTIVKFESLTSASFPDAASFLAAAKDAAGGRKLVKVQGVLSPNGSVRWDRAELEMEHEFRNEVENEFEFEFEVEHGFENEFEHGGGHS
jgi:hypothetical protein